MIKDIIIVTLQSGYRLVGTLVHMQRGLISLEYPFYVATDDTVAVPDDVQVKTMNIPIDSMASFDMADQNILDQYQLFVTAILSSNMLKSAYPSKKMSSVDNIGAFKFYNCINRQSPELN